MPIYEYRCGNCGHEMEAIQKISDDPLVRCPHCEQDALVKKVSAAGFRLKGGGWYETDFKSGKKRNVSETGSSESGSKSASSGKSESATKSASAGKSESATSVGSGSSKNSGGSASSGSSTSD